MAELLTRLLPPEIGLPIGLGLVLLAFFTAAVTAAAGIGGGVILLSVMVSVLPPAIALPVHGVVQVGSNVGRSYFFRHDAHWPTIAWFSAGAVVGVAIAAQVFVALPVALLEAVIGLFVLWSVWAPKLRPADIKQPGFFGVGAITSFLTLFVGATGPFVAAFLSPQRFGRHSLVGTHAICMTLQHGFKIAAFGVLGFAYLPWAPLLIAMLGSGFLGTLFGRAVLNRMNDQHFAWAFKIVLTLLGLRLLWQAGSELL